MSTAIVIRKLLKSFPGGLPGSMARTTIAVDNVDLDIAPGELFFLLGPSGCGKTTLLRMIAGFIEPNSGSIVFRESTGQDRDVTYTPPNKRNTGMVFQSYALWPHMTVGENVAFGLSVRRVTGSDQERRMEEALRLVRMESYVDRKPTELSGGQQQRVALARALVVRPSVLLLDEPLSNLDAKLRSELRSEIRRICKESGLTTVYVTHDQKEALSMADRIGLMRSGRLEQVGTPRELYFRPSSRFAAEFIGDSNFLDGTVEQVDADVATVATAAGVIRAPIAFHVERGGKVIVSARHEGVRVTSQPGGVRATVEDASFLGEAIQITTKLTNGARLIALARDKVALSVGSEAYLTLDPDSVAIVPIA